MSLHTFIRQMPKVELHIHLEGSIRPATLLTLAERNGIPLPVTDLDAMRSFYRFTDFDRFLQIYFTISGCLKTVADFELIAYELGSSMVRQQILYAEVTFTPYTNVVNTSLSFEEIMEGLSEGRLRARAEFGVEMCWILDIVRDQPDTRHQVVEWAISAQDQGVIGLGLGGTERDHPPEWFADVYARAREAGLHSVPHAGEVAGPASVWKALGMLGAERIGHGVRSVEDPDLIAYLRQQQIPLEVCPTSNVCLGVYASYAEHPLRKLWEEGLYITINSDDPPMFNTDLVNEYQVLVDQMGFSAQEVERLSLNALRASFLPQEQKADLEQRFLSDFAQLRVLHLEGEDRRER